MNIRKAKPDDASVLSELFQSLVGEDLKSKEQIRKHIINGTKEYFLAIDKHPVGGVSVIYQGKDCELDALGVKEKRQGLGRQLLQFAEEQARNHGCTRIWTYSYVSHGAKGFYEKCGWTVVELIKDYTPGRDCYKLEKALETNNPD